MTDQTVHEHSLASTSPVLDLLKPFLPTGIALYRRIQFEHFTPDSHLLCSLTPAECQNPTQPWIAAFVDRSRRPETEVWTSGSWEYDGHKEDDSTSQRSAETLVKALIARIAKYGLPGPGVAPHEDAQDTGPADDTTFKATKANSRDSAATTVPRSAYNTHLQTPSIVLVGAVHASTVALFRAADLLAPGLVGPDIPYGKYVFDLTAPLPVARPLPAGLRWGTVRPCDFALVRARTQIPRRDATLALLPSAALFVDGDEGAAMAVPVAWAFLGLDASLTTLHVEAGYRGLGLAKAVALRLFAEEMRVYVGERGGATGERWGHADVATDNAASIGVCESLGGKRVFLDYWVRLDMSRAT